MRILLLGASGFIGQNLHRALQQAGHEVRPLARRFGVDVRTLTTATAWLPYLDKVDAVINAIGIIGETQQQSFSTLHSIVPCALFNACATLGAGQIKQVIQISALGADHTAFSVYHRSKLVADDYLRRLPLPWLVLRPGLIYGQGSRSGDLLLRLARLPWLPVLGTGQQILNPVHIRDVVACVCQACCGDVADPSKTQLQQTLDVIGSSQGGQVTFRDWLATLRAVQGLPPARVLSCPLSLALAVAYVARYLQPIMQPETLLMLERGYRVDANALARLTTFLGRPPLAPQRDLFFMDGISHDGH